MNILDYIVDPYTKSKVKEENKNLLKFVNQK